MTFRKYKDQANLQKECTTYIDAKTIWMTHIGKNRDKVTLGEMEVRTNTKFYNDYLTMTTTDEYAAHENMQWKRMKGM